MQVVQPKVIIANQDWSKLQKEIEAIGRVCYKSEAKITTDSADTFIAKLIERGHGSVLEHRIISAKFIVDRGVSHELVRHRIASFSQESTRYCNYGGKDIQFIEPFFFKNDPNKMLLWQEACKYSEASYNMLLRIGAKPQEARDVLNNSLKTEVWVTANIRQWLKAILHERTSPAAHPQMRQVMIPTLLALKELMPIIFSNCEYDTEFPEEHYAKVTVEDLVIEYADL